MLIRPFYLACLAHASYMLADEKTKIAVIVDPQRDVDLYVAEAAKLAVKSRYVNVGQSCVNAKRFIVENSVADQFVAAFMAGVEKLKIGDPLEAGVSIGETSPPAVAL